MGLVDSHARVCTDQLGVDELRDCLGWSVIHSTLTPISGILIHMEHSAGVGVDGVRSRCSLGEGLNSDDLGRAFGAVDIEDVALDE